MWRVWSSWAWLDTKRAYRRSLLGSLWVTISQALFVIGLAIIFSTIFNVEIREFTLYVAGGIVGWNFINSFVRDGAVTFVSAGSQIRSYNLPLSLYVFRLGAKNFLNFLHILVIPIGVIAFFQMEVSPLILMSLIGIAAIFINGIWVSLLLAPMCVRYRDLVPIIQTTMQMLFFLTPVFWRADALSARMQIAYYNPFYHFLELFRAPLLGYMPSATNYLVVFWFTVLGSLAGVIVFSRYRHRVAYWI